MPETETELINQGALAFQRGDFKDAEQLYSQALSLNRSARALGNRSACRAKLQQFDEALTDAMEAAALDTKSAKLQARVGTALEGLKRFEEALEAYEKAKSLDPTNNSYSERIEQMQQLIASGSGIASKKSRDTYCFEKSITLAKEAMQKDQLHEALRHYDKAVSLCPGAKDLSVLYSNRSVVHFKIGAFDKAASDAQNSIDCDPTYARARLRLAMACEKQHYLDDALTHVDECLRLDAANVQAAELRKSILSAIESRNTTAAEQEAAHAAKVKEIERTRDLERQAMRATAPVFASSYLHCNFCNEYGHTRNDCPLRRKRQRE
jgi:tetratricopeptide (TPR) repeat protein